MNDSVNDAERDRLHFLIILVVGWTHRMAGLDWTGVVKEGVKARSRLLPMAMAIKTVG